ncbi:MAG: response regulator [Labilithrix sp.]|nr:response regulator [Labilithrix sp.]
MRTEHSLSLRFLPTEGARANREPAPPATGGGLRLGGARADFVAGLGRKVTDLRTGLARVREQPDDVARREELRRKLHALSSAAKLMKFDAMERAIAEALGTIDRTAIDVPLDEMDIDAIDQILEDLPALAWGDGDARISRLTPIAKPVAPKFSVLVVGSHLIAEALLEEAPDDDDGRAAFECESTPDAQAAFDLARTTEPDLVILDADLDCAAELVEALMDDPLTEGAPIVVVGSFLSAGEASRYVAMGVAKTLPKPTSRDALRTACEDALGVRRQRPAHAMLGEPTLVELGDRLASELREALLGNTEPSLHGRKIPLGEGAEVLGALWSAIARVREVVTSRTDGEVRFNGGPEGGLPIASPLRDVELARADRARARARGAAAEVRLQGRRIVVADDDPGVVWFMADLLKTAGCVVHEAFNGRQALELAYRTTPDLVISDILMPELDGFALCRALRRDVALRDVPVILLSWKEDLLQRVRELGANAAGYVRKESDTRAIVARVREALRPRARIEQRLRDDGEVRGRIDGVSVRTLLEIVCATRPEARVSVRDASFNYEVEIRFGAPQRATRTAGDGSFLKGSRVLAAMLGVGAGRFTVTPSVTEIHGELDGNLAAQLAKPIARARAATALLTGPSAMLAGRVQLDEEALADYLRATPDGARSIAERIADGTPPRALVVEGVAEASLVEDLVCDLAARGVVAGIEDEDGNDVFGPEIERSAQHTDARASFAPRTATPAPLPANDCVPDAPGPICESPACPAASAPLSAEPASSLEDAVMQEIAQRSPEPAQLRLALGAEGIADPSKRRPQTSPPPEAVIENTPPHDQILALAEPTIVDDTVYGREPSIPIDEASRAIGGNEDEENERRAALTPLSVVSGAEPKLEVPTRRIWPMVAFVAASAVVTWAVVHFSLTPPPAKHVETVPPPPVATQTPSADVTYTDVAQGADLPAGQGVLDVSGPGDAVILVDGAERGRGGVTLPLWGGSHDVRISGVAGEHAKAVEVRPGRVAHVKF